MDRKASFLIYVRYLPLYLLYLGISEHSPAWYMSTASGFALFEAFPNCILLLSPRLKIQFQPLPGCVAFHRPGNTIWTEEWGSSCSITDQILRVICNHMCGRPTEVPNIRPTKSYVEDFVSIFLRRVGN